MKRIRIDHPGNWYTEITAAHGRIAITQDHLGKSLKVRTTMEFTPEEAGGLARWILLQIEPQP